MRFEYNSAFVNVAFKASEFSGNFGGVGPAAPPGVLAFCSVAVQERFFEVFLYDDEGRTTERDYPFSSIPIQDGGPDGITRIDVTGSPVVVIHDGIVKVFYANYFDGPKPEQLWRLNTGWKLVP